MISVHCYECLGTGQKKFNDGIVFRYEICPRCNGLGGVIAKEGSGEHRIAANIGAMRKAGKVFGDDKDYGR